MANGSPSGSTRSAATGSSRRCSNICGRSSKDTELRLTEEDQARGLVRVYLISAAIPWIERVYFFQLCQEAAYTEIVANGDAYMGLVTPWLEGQGRPKNAYFAVRAVIKVLNQSAYKGRIETAFTGLVPPFQSRKGATFALWSLDNGVDNDGSGMRRSIEGGPDYGGHSGTREEPPGGLRTASLPGEATRDDAERLKQQIREARWKKEH